MSTQTQQSFGCFNHQQNVFLLLTREMWTPVSVCGHSTWEQSNPPAGGKCSCLDIMKWSMQTNYMNPKFSLPLGFTSSFLWSEQHLLTCQSWGIKQMQPHLAALNTSCEALVHEKNGRSTMISLRMNRSRGAARAETKSKILKQFVRWK